MPSIGIPLHIRGAYFNQSFDGGPAWAGWRATSVGFARLDAGHFDYFESSLLYAHPNVPTLPSAGQLQAGTTIDNCTACFVLKQNCEYAPSSQICERLYLATRGSYAFTTGTLNASRGRFAGQGTNLHYEEWDPAVDQPVLGGDCYDVGSLAFDVGWDAGTCGQPSTFTVPCGAAACPTNSVCTSGGCACKAGYAATSCAGPPCPGGTCTGTNYWCKPNAPACIAAGMPCTPPGQQADKANPGTCCGGTQCIASHCCAPMCAGKACGAADGCGGTCGSGTCPANEVCTVEPPIAGPRCLPDCSGKTCGASGGSYCVEEILGKPTGRAAGICGTGQLCKQQNVAGGPPKCCSACTTCGQLDSCGWPCFTGACPAGMSCRTGQCVCTPNCAGKPCGAPDGCGGTCKSGSCGNSQSQCTNGVCSCTPSCLGKACGAPDGCGGLCQTGTCPGGQQCVGGACGCAPSCAGKVCGAPNGCGGQCQGSCPSGQYCSSNTCVSTQVGGAGGGGGSSACHDVTALCAQVTSTQSSQPSSCPSGQGIATFFVSNQCSYAIQVVLYVDDGSKDYVLVQPGATVSNGLYHCSAGGSYRAVLATDPVACYFPG